MPPSKAPPASPVAAPVGVPAKPTAVASVLPAVSAASAPARPMPAAAETSLLSEEAAPDGRASGESLKGVPPPQPPAGAALEEAQWRAAVEAVRATSARHAASLAQGRLVALREGEVVLAYRPEASFHRTTVSSQSGRVAVERVLSQHFGRPTTILLDDAAAATAPKSLAERDAEARAAHEQSTDQTVRGHPAIRAALRILGGELEHIQVLERERTGAPGSDILDEPP